MIPPHVATARALIGKRWRHRARGPWHVDCVGLAAVALAANGYTVDDRVDYAREPDGASLRAELRARFGDPVRTPRVGDIALFRGVTHPLHVGVFGDYFLGGLSLIHASNEPGIGRVVEVRFGGEWTRRFIEAYRPGVR